MITKAQQIEYRDGYITIRNASSDEDQIANAESIYDDGLDVEIVEPVVGWDEYTHVARIDGQYYLIVNDQDAQ